jgi:hypothetical protein
MRARALLLAAACVGSGAAGCASTPIPDPRAAALAYADAAARGDADTLYAMFSEASRRSLGPDDVRARVADERRELAEQAGELRGRDARLEATARMRFADGEEVSLDLRDGAYGVTTAGALPGGGRTPGEALDQLRRALARRSYAGLVRLLSAGTRSAVETDMRAIVEGLGNPADLAKQPVGGGDAVRVTVPGGHRVLLKREGGIWRVESFD